MTFVRRPAPVVVLLSLLLATAFAPNSNTLASPRGSELARKRIVYRHKLQEYEKARTAYESLARPYWALISDKRSHRLEILARNERPILRDYVLDQPPSYSGPPQPESPDKKSAGEYVPVVADFLAQAKGHFNFVPDLPEDDTAYRRAYARAALAAGLNAEQCVKVYAFESGGDGGYAVQAGLEYDRPGAHAITTALGYNQLLTTNSIELLAEAGDNFVAALRTKAARAEGERRARLIAKVASVERMIGFSRSVPDRWSAHARLAATPNGIAVHALILDVDIGPLLQVQKLLTSVAFAKRRGYMAPLTAAELEMMNLTGDGTGFDMVTMPEKIRDKVPTSNFFQRGGYERNPVAIRNNTVAKLIATTDAKMESESQLDGAKALAAVFKEHQ